MFSNKVNPVDELKSIFPNSDNSSDAAFAWAEGVLKKENIDPKKNTMTAMKKLRDKEPALSLVGVTYLVQKLNK